MKINKKRIISIVLIAIVIMFLMSVAVFATTPDINNPDTFKPGDISINDNKNFLSKAGSIVGLVRTIGFIVAVIALTGIGIKYIFTSIEGRAEYKKAMIPYVVGCFLLVGTSGLISIISGTVNVSYYDELYIDLQDGKKNVSDLSNATLRRLYAKEYGIEEIVWENAKNGRDYTEDLDDIRKNIYQQCQDKGLLQINNVFLDTSDRTMARFKTTNGGGSLICDKCNTDYLIEGEGEGDVANITPAVALEWFLKNKNSTCKTCAYDKWETDDEAKVVALVVNNTLVARAGRDNIITDSITESNINVATDEQIEDYLMTGIIDIGIVPIERLISLYEHLEISNKIENLISDSDHVDEGYSSNNCDDCYNILKEYYNSKSQIYAQVYNRIKELDSERFQPGYIYLKGNTNNYTLGIYFEATDGEGPYLMCGSCKHKIRTNFGEETCKKWYDGNSNWKCQNCQAEIRMIMYSDGKIMKNRHYSYLFWV